ncbi:hypothetical protein TKK_0002231 [Trichogramma kaykai]|uniref:Uncharacterized protein n=1 Tax=Trichogramma kaykai TaxID=54128 RepID=A0ABD2XBP8_9HYME
MKEKSSESSKENMLSSNVENVEKQVGRPKTEFEYPDLLKTACDIAICNSAADGRRHTEEIRTCNTLDELTENLQKKGFSLSKSAVYQKFLPRRSSTLAGRRHVTKVPVRLCKLHNDLHISHVVGRIRTTIIRNVDTLAEILGPMRVSHISKDDKARVKIGITAANK